MRKLKKKVQNNYLKELRCQLIDKAFFLEKLPPYITTILDYGCADGALLNFIRETDIIKDKNAESDVPAYELVGVESDDNFRRHAMENGVEVYENLDDVLISTNHYDMEKTCVNFSSSLHEMFWTDRFAAMEILRRFQRDPLVGAISIRDMWLEFPWDRNSMDSNVISYVEVTSLMRALIQCYPVHFSAFVSSHIPPEIMCDKDKLFTQLIHFMLKCIYIGDEYIEDGCVVSPEWSNECVENYLAFQKYFQNAINYDYYTCIWSLNYSLPYLNRVWHEKFMNCGIDGILDKIGNLVKTHKQMLFVRKPR